MNPQRNTFIFPEMNFSRLSRRDIIKNCPKLLQNGAQDIFTTQPDQIEVNAGVFLSSDAHEKFPAVSVIQSADHIAVVCSCINEAGDGDGKLCLHQAATLLSILDNRRLLIFFDKHLRYQKLLPAAAEYGLEKEAELDDYFQLIYGPEGISVQPKKHEIIPIEIEKLRQELLPADTQSKSANTLAGEKIQFISIRRHRFYKHLYIDLMEAAVSASGKIKSPLVRLEPAELIWSAKTTDTVKFYAALQRFQQNTPGKRSQADWSALKIITANPLKLPVYYQKEGYEKKVKNDLITVASLAPINIAILDAKVTIVVDRRLPFYVISGEFIHNGVIHRFDTLKIQYDSFFRLDDQLLLIQPPGLLSVIEFFRKTSPKAEIWVHNSRYDHFRSQVLAEMEEQFNVRYTYTSPATPLQMRELTDEGQPERLIYLKEEGDFVHLTPVVRYNNTEIELYSRKQLYELDSRGRPVILPRDEALEIRFTVLITRQHPEFEPQLLEPKYFYLHRDKFLDEDWFLEALDAWRAEGILIMGFKELRRNRLNPYKAKVKIQVTSGTDWFHTALTVQYGPQRASLKSLHTALQIKSKYVLLDDGSKGLIPEAWLKRLSDLFQQAVFAQDLLKIPKAGFREINSLFEESELSGEVRREIDGYTTRFEHLHTIPAIKVPVGLKTQLRDYQQEGLNWLCLMDSCNFGACLADDMGLGKTLQVIAFLLTQRGRAQNTNLIIVPTSLLFNWRAEIEKFAPSLKVDNYYGPGRRGKIAGFDKFEVILTSYGTMLSDIRQLKNYHFNYLIMDESQAIKNPDSDRYKAARQLKSRNKIILTGTPFENSSFDLYGQLSFACPGLLGSKRYFKEVYGVPIDKFEDRARAQMLQEKIRPFVLRRTKSQVTRELPEKTEMVLYAPLGQAQRKIYNACEKELRDYITNQDADKLAASSIHVLSGLTRLRQICDDPTLVKELPGWDPNCSSAKMELLMDQITSQATAHKVLVFSQFVSMLDLIKKQLQLKKIPFEYLTGGTKTSDRAKRVAAFQEKEDIRVFLISLKAGGTGLNLTEADYVYIVDPWWNPAVENQAIDRCHRIGQDKKVIAVRLICPDTVEEKIMQLQEAKKQRAGELIKTDKSIFKNLTKPDLLQLLQ